MKYYRYTAFGMQIDSDIMLPELARGEKKQTDVRIICGDVPDKISEFLEETGYYQAAANEFLLRIKGVADYYITNGNQIVMHLVNTAAVHSGRMYLLGTAMGVLLMQRGIMPIHGSTVVINGCGVVFAGTSGAGKSTVAAALHRNGFLLLADDVSAVRFDKDGIPWVQPGYPQQKLWQASAAVIGIDTTTLDRVCAQRAKYIVPVARGFRKIPIPINTIYEIDVKPCGDVIIVPLKGIEKITAIMSNTYRVEMINGLGLKAEHFKKCVDLSKHVRMFRLIRPENVMLVDKQSELLVKHFMGLSRVNQGKTDNAYENVARVH